jgi:hypothetical protein
MAVAVFEQASGRPDGRGQAGPALLGQVEDVVVATLESKPKDATHWSRKSMAAKSGLSKSVGVV